MTGTGVTALGRPFIAVAPGSRIEIGDRVSLASTSQGTALGVAHPVVLRTMSSSAELSIGPDTGMSGSTICAVELVRLGARVLVGADVLIMDTHFHPVHRVPRRYEPLPASTESDHVLVEDDVFIGARSIVLPGAKIGRGSVIGAGSVVADSIPAGTIAVGNPCRPVGSLDAIGSA